MVTLMIIGIVLSLGYWASLWLWPMRTCPRCRGARKLPGHGDTFRWCARCGATGHVRRLGARKED